MSGQVIVRCPRCGSLEAESAEPVGIEFDRMACGDCGHTQICDDTQIRFEWNEHVDPTTVRLDQHWVLPFDRFQECWRALGAEGHGRDVFLRLRAAYDEPHRAYHTARHIGSCLALLDDRPVRALASAIAEVEAAIWFHDAVYDPRAKDNEERSADLALECLTPAGVAADAAARVAAMIRATANHAATTPDGQLLVDVDLAILGAKPEAFARFEREIRQEYSWVDDAAYRRGRAQVLRRFADRPQLYGTPALRERFEARARENVTAALARLEEAQS